MKKFACLALAVICLFVFVACSDDSASMADRWEDASADFTISLLQDEVRDSNNNIIKKKDEGFFNFSTNAGTQVKPDAISSDSRFSYEIKAVNGNWELTQTLVVKETFLKTKHSFLSGDAWKSVVENDETVFEENTNGDAVFTSTMTSSVTFKTFKNGGAAIKSSKTVKSVFVYVSDNDGSHDIAYNNYEVSVDYSGKTAKTTFTDNTEAKLWQKPSGDVRVTSGVFDNEMLLFTMRSYDLKKVIELGASFSSYNAFEQTTQTVSVSAAVYDEEVEVDKQIYIAQAAPSGQASYPYLFYFETAASHRPAGSVTGKIPAYNLIKFSQGYMKFSAL